MDLTWHVVDKGEVEEAEISASRAEEEASEKDNGSGELLPLHCWNLNHRDSYPGAG